MGKMEFRLNPKKPGNYAFFCPVTRLHLTLANPVGYTDRISNYILRAVKGGTLIDVNKAVNLETGEKINNKPTAPQQEVKEPEKPVETVTPVQEEPTQEEPVQQEPAQEEVQQEVQPEQVEELQSQEAEVTVDDVEEKKANKRGKKPQN